MQIATEINRNLSGNENKMFLISRTAMSLDNTTENDKALNTAQMVTSRHWNDFSKPFIINYGGLHRRYTKSIEMGSVPCFGLGSDLCI